MANENTKNPSTTQPSSPAAAAKPHAKPDAEVEAAPTKERFYLVEQDREIPRGGGSILLHKGKRISTHGYDIEQLKRHGVKLTEVPVSQ